MFQCLGLILSIHSQFTCCWEKGSSHKLMISSPLTQHNPVYQTVDLHIWCLSWKHGEIYVQLFFCFILGDQGYFHTKYFDSKHEPLLFYWHSPESHHWGVAFQFKQELARQWKHMDERGNIEVIVLNGTHLDMLWNDIVTTCKYRIQHILQYNDPWWKLRPKCNIRNF